MLRGGSAGTIRASDRRAREIAMPLFMDVHEKLPDGATAVEGS
jgi:hypothetical protein